MSNERKYTDGECKPGNLTGDGVHVMHPAQKMAIDAFVSELPPHLRERNEQFNADVAADARRRELVRMQKELELRGSTSGEYGEPTSPLPTDSAARKEVPLWTGCVRYFVAALGAIACTSKKGNDKHNPGQELHHARWKSMDHSDCLMRHLTDYESWVAYLERHPDTSSVTVDMLEEELGNLGWRTLAYIQQELERLGRAPLAPAARVQK